MSRMKAFLINWPLLVLVSVFVAANASASTSASTSASASSSAGATASTNGAAERVTSQGVMQARGRLLQETVSNGTGPAKAATVGLIPGLLQGGGGT